MSTINCDSAGEPPVVLEVPCVWTLPCDSTTWFQRSYCHVSSPCKKSARRVGEHPNATPLTAHRSNSDAAIAIPLLWWVLWRSIIVGSINFDKHHQTPQITHQWWIWRSTTINNHPETPGFVNSWCFPAKPGGFLALNWVAWDTKLRSWRLAGSWSIMMSLNHGPWLLIVAIMMMMFMVLPTSCHDGCHHGFTYQVAMMLQDDTMMILMVD